MDNFSTRQEGRFYRDRCRREEKRKAFQSQYGSIEQINTITNIANAFQQTKRGVSWKNSIQKIEVNPYRSFFNIQKRIITANILSQLNVFFVNERGKLRKIESVDVYERIIQHLLCDECLGPIVSHYIIYDNGASMKNKGTHFALARLSKHMRNFYKETGSNEGFILLIDFSDFFHRILHQPLFEMVDGFYIDPELKVLFKLLIDRFESGGLGLGSQVSQLFAIFYLNSIEHYIKDQLGIKYYTRYMDDSTFIFKTKEECYRMLEILRPLYESLGIKINEKKTKVVPVNKEFTFLKTKFVLTETGAVVRKITKGGVKRFNNKIKSFNKLLLNGEMTIEQALAIKISFKAYFKGKKSRKTYIRYVKKFDKMIKNVCKELGIELVDGNKINKVITEEEVNDMIKEEAPLIDW